jgi:hypothetical protein
MGGYVIAIGEEIHRMPGTVSAEDTAGASSVAQASDAPIAAIGNRRTLLSPYRIGAGRIDLPSRKGPHDDESAFP